MATTFMRFRVQLAGVKPAIWRQFLLRADASFLALHEAIQDACGWENTHLFVFREKNGEPVAGIPDDSGFGDSDPDASKVKLSSWFSLTGNKQCVYEYDFGDGWLHDVRFETLEQHDARWKRCLVDGARAFPPEDCGGIGGYQECVEVVTTGEDPEDRAEWIGNWQPEVFDLAKAKKRFDR